MHVYDCITFFLAERTNASQVYCWAIVDALFILGECSVFLGSWSLFNRCCLTILITARIFVIRYMCLHVVKTDRKSGQLLTRHNYQCATVAPDYVCLSPENEMFSVSVWKCPVTYCFHTGLLAGCKPPPHWKQNSVAQSVIGETFYRPFWLPHGGVDHTDSECGKGQFTQTSRLESGWLSDYRNQAGMWCSPAYIMSLIHTLLSPILIVLAMTAFYIAIVF